MLMLLVVARALMERRTGKRRMILTRPLWKQYAVETGCSIWVRTEMVGATGRETNFLTRPS